MTIFAIIYGLSIIGIGMLAERYPNLMSGYNTMSKEKKANVDIAAVAKTMRQYMVAAGVTTIIVSLALPYLELGSYTIYGLTTPLFVALGIASIKVQRYDCNKRSWLERNTSTMIIFAAAIFVIFSIVQGSTPASITIEEEALVVNCRYGTSTPLEAIESVTLLENMPHIAARIKGSDTGDYLKGNFRFKDKELGICLLYIKPSSAPYIHIKRAEGRDIIFNTPDSLTTYQLYNTLLERCQ